MKQGSLSTTEQREFGKLEAVIKKGLRSFVEVGQALMDVRDKRLYRAQYPSFEAYCQDRWGIGARRSRQLISGSVVVFEMKDRNPGSVLPILPESEKQARPLAGLSPGQREHVWGQAVAEAGGQPTSSRVEELARAALASLPPERQREVLAREEERIQQSRQDHEIKAQSDSRDRRIEQIRYLSGRVRKLTEGLGGEADVALEQLNGFDREIRHLADI